ncbi:MAG: L,D-transpeptidase family protein [Proteobacteria bacterium]|nr:L,D-transpeptidase family protein [Pseudomonadota bacterium]
MQVVAAALVLFLTVLSSPSAGNAEEAKAALSPAAAGIEQLVRSRGDEAGEPLELRAQLERFYSARSFEPAFGSERDSRALIEAIKGAGEHGLRPERYHLNSIERLESGPARDVLMTDAFLTLASHLDAGIENPYFSRANQQRPQSGTDLVAALAAALERRDVKGALERLAPQTEEYRRLMAAMKRADEMAASESWPRVPEGGARKIEPGKRDPRIPAIRARLAAEGFVQGPSRSAERNRSEINGHMAASSAALPEDLYDEELVQAVMSFQEKYGLGVDGVIGRATLANLNYDPAFRACQVRVNLDRLRGLRHVIVTDRYALVNIPEFSLTIYENGAPIKEMKVIAGMVDRKSPLMSDNIRFIVFSPKWHVPRSIAVKDKLPKIKKDPSYIRRQGMKVYTVGETGIEEVEPESIDWEEVDASNFAYRIVQDARDDNALGRVKFMFPNRHDVYLHDTPTKSLFNSGTRTFSSGCIRISDPIWFAEYLLRDTGAWDRGRIDGAMKRASPLVVDLPEKMPIHILYISARGDERGEPVFRHDVYGFDRALSKRLCGQ